MTNPPNNLQLAIQQVYADHRRIVKEKNRQINELQASNGALQRALQERPDTPSEALIERAEKAEMGSARAAEVAERWREAYDDLVTIRRTDPHRPLAADDITGEMVGRAWFAFWDAPGGINDMHSMRLALAAALTEPPARPEGAEKVEAVLHQYWSGDINGDDLADRIVEEMNR